MVFGGVEEWSFYEVNDNMSHRRQRLVCKSRSSSILMYSFPVWLLGLFD